MSAHIVAVTTTEGAAGTYKVEPVTKNYAAQNVSNAMVGKVFSITVFSIKVRSTVAKTGSIGLKKSVFSLQCINMYSINRQIYRIKIFKG